jgi:hypothetical protein
MIIKSLGKSSGVFVYCKKEKFDDIKDRFLNTDSNLDNTRQASVENEIKTENTVLTSHLSLFVEGTTTYALYNFYLRD